MQDITRDKYAIYFAWNDDFKDSFNVPNAKERDLNIRQMINHKEFKSIRYCRIYANGEYGKEKNHMKKEPQILGQLMIGANSCTEPIKIHPLGSDTWCLVPDDVDSHKEKIDYASLISFRKRQVWKVYYYRFADCRGWCVERPGLYLRMPEKDFEKFFGKYEIIEKDIAFPAPKSPVFGHEDMTCFDDLTEEELREVLRYAKEIKERKRAK